MCYLPPFKVLAILQLRVRLESPSHEDDDEQPAELREFVDRDFFEDVLPPSHLVWRDSGRDRHDASPARSFSRAISPATRGALPAWCTPVGSDHRG